MERLEGTHYYLVFVLFLSPTMFKSACLHICFAQHGSHERHDRPHSVFRLRKHETPLAVKKPHRPPPPDVSADSAKTPPRR
mmetsp:Transcript_28128/g.64374  ORF Transcript_28128/g.64374 Transcript_28128/m.64374 type:complete len:81 (+) Transcript_28128:96-338(+)